MLSSEKKRREDQNTSSGCQGLTYLYSSHRRQSHCLEANLSEVDEKIKTMVSIIEDDGDTFAKRAEMFFKRRPQLLNALDDLHKSCRCLAFNSFTPRLNLSSNANEETPVQTDNRDRMWSEKEVSDLIEDHLRQQAELVKRNDGMKLKIKELTCQLKKLVDENQALKLNHKSSKGTVLYHLGKLTGCSR